MPHTTMKIQVNTYNEDEQGWSSVGIDSVGNFVVAWHSHYQDG